METYEKVKARALQYLPLLELTASLTPTRIDDLALALIRELLTNAGVDAKARELYAAIAR